MTNDQLTAILAQRVMNWRVGPNRYLTGNRHWMPLWRFQPLARLPDAVRLLEAAAPERYTIQVDKNGLVWVLVQIAGKTGEARERSRTRAIVLAIARALQIPVDSLENWDRDDEPPIGGGPKRKRRDDDSA
jgi:hypothetical protein